LIVRLTQIDGKLPNLALMRLSAFHKGMGHTVVFTRSLEREPDEPAYDRVYASAIFYSLSTARIARFNAAWPGAVVGGTGFDKDAKAKVEHIVGAFEQYDYSLYPDFKASIGYSQRGCRLKCHFCVVPKIEPGKPWSLGPIARIWRGDPHPKKIHLLDNDFFGAEDWREKIREIREGGFKICFNQGINVRMVMPEVAEALASIQYRNDDFNRRMLYTAWDNLGDERRFFDGVDLLERAGVPPKHLMAYMLIGYAPDETWARIWYRFGKMVERGILPYPMVYDSTRLDLKAFQRWVITGLYRAKSCPWPLYESPRKSEESVLAWEKWRGAK
jgi:hypothetical protein